MIRVVSWNIAKRLAPWRELVNLGADVALVQEGWTPPLDVADSVEIGPKESYDSHHWNSDWWKDRWPYLAERWPIVVKLSDNVDVEWFKQVAPISMVAEDEIAVTGIGTITAARVTPKDSSIEQFIAVSMYGKWLSPHPSTKSRWIYGDASAHRIISDLSAFIGHEDSSKHRIVAAGDLNLFYGHGDNGDPYWEARYRSVFERMNAIGLEFIGPQAPNGRQAEMPPPGQPADSLNVPTFYPVGQTPSQARNQLDFAFASRGFHESINVRALNEVNEWGPSDHCRILIEIDG